MPIKPKKKDNKIVLQTLDENKEMEIIKMHQRTTHIHKCLLVQNKLLSGKILTKMSKKETDFVHLNTVYARD